jgi:hypothetical protein
MKATRPKEYICFLPVAIHTALDGDVYSIFALDTFSKFMFHTGTERELTKETILKNIKLLLDNKDFRKHRIKNFTLVFGSFAEWKEEIEELIAPYGKMLINKEFVTENFTPVLEKLSNNLKTPPSTLN